MIHCRHFLRCSMWWSSGAVLRLDRGNCLLKPWRCPHFWLQRYSVRIYVPKQRSVAFKMRLTPTHPIPNLPRPGGVGRWYFFQACLLRICAISVQNASTETQLSYTTSLVGCLYGRAPKPRPCPKYCRGLWHEHVGVRRSVLRPPKYAKMRSRGHPSESYNDRSLLLASKKQ